MEPRSFKRGNGAARRHVANAPPRFNGATLIQAWKRAQVAPVQRSAMTGFNGATLIQAWKLGDTR